MLLATIFMKTKGFDAGEARRVAAAQGLFLGSNLENKDSIPAASRLR
jgi:hypothetical protein